MQPHRSVVEHKQTLEADRLHVGTVAVAIVAVAERKMPAGNSVGHCCLGFDT